MIFKQRNAPGPIAYHTMTLIGHHVYLIGGSALGVDSIRDYVLDLHTLEWTPIERVDKNAPKSIDEHTATLIGDQIYIFGGNIAGFKNDQMFVFDPHSKHWSKLEHSSGP